MNQFIKIIIRGEVMVKRTNLTEHKKMFVFGASFPLRTASCPLVCPRQPNYFTNNHRTFSISSVNYRNRVDFLPKTETIIGLKKKIKKTKDGKDDMEEYLCNDSEKTTSLKKTRRKIKEKGKLLMKDIKETKNKMKEKLEGVIEEENIYTIPNLLCVTRIGLSPLLGYLIVSEKYEYALGFMILAGVSDWVDGWIARNYKSQSSKIGSFLDPMADKVLIGTLFLTLTYIGQIPGILTALILGKDVILIISGFVIRYMSLPPPRTISRYFDVTYPTAQLAPTFISKVNTGIQLILAATTLAAPTFGYVNHSFLHTLWYVTAASTIVAAGSYAISKETYKFLREAEKGRRSRK